MKKAAFQFLLLILLFAGTWFTLSRIDFVSIFKLKEKNDLSEKKIGDILLKAYIRAEEEINDSTLSNSLDEIKTLICTANGIEPESIRLHIIDKSDVNAFALPNGHIVILTGLLVDTKNAEEFAGVLAHEIAHIEKHHVMEKLSKEVGISIIGTVLGGSGSGEIIRELLKTVSSRAYDRRLEAEADKTATDFLYNAGIDTEPFANFLYRMGESDLPGEMEWLNTHPNSRDRSAEVLKSKKEPKSSVPITTADWEQIRGKARTAGKDIRFRQDM